MLPDRTFQAFLFDMDGTLLTSIASAERVWTRWAREHGIDPAPMLATMHGVRAVETVARHAPPGTDAQAEADRITLMEIEDIEGTAAIAGAGDFVRSLPADRWAIVTSAPRALALVRLEAAGLPVPGVFVTAEDVARGKPAPDAYLLAADRLGFPASDCLVFEDAHAGIMAGEAAGATVCVVTACLSASFETDRPSIESYRGLSVAVDPREGRLGIVRN